MWLMLLVLVKFRVLRLTFLKNCMLLLANQMNFTVWENDPYTKTFSVFHTHYRDYIQNFDPCTAVIGLIHPFNLLIFTTPIYYFQQIPKLATTETLNLRAAGPTEGGDSVVERPLHAKFQHHTGLKQKLPWRAHEYSVPDQLCPPQWNPRWYIKLLKLPSKAVQLPQASITGPTALGIFRDDTESNPSRSGIEPHLKRLTEGSEGADSSKRSKLDGVQDSVGIPVFPHVIGLSIETVLVDVCGGKAVQYIILLQEDLYQRILVMCKGDRIIHQQYTVVKVDRRAT